MWDRSRAAAAALSLATLLVPATGSAQRPENEEALRLFEEGTVLNKEGRAQEACAALLASLKIERSINAYFQLGKCNETLERFQSAREAYWAAAEMSRTAGDGEREKVARTYADGLTPRIPALHIAPVDPARNLSVRQNGSEVPREQWSKPLPINPGAVTIEATAPGKRPFTMQLTAPASATAIGVQIPALKDLDDDDDDDDDRDRDKDRPTGPALQRRSTGLFATGITFLCVGGLATVAGIVGIAAGSEEGDFDDVEPAWIGVAVGGVALLGAGIPLTVVFGKRVPASGDEPVPKAPAKPAGTTELYLAPTGGSLHVTF